MKMKKLSLVLIVCSLSVSLPRPAFAYLDPGTGSMFLQLLIGGIAGVLVIGRLYWAKLKRLLTRGAASQEDADTRDEA